MPFAKQSLRGWKTRFPGKVRSGVDLAIWDLMALQCHRHGPPLAAAGILLQGDSCLRTGELFSFTKKHLISPRAARSKGIWGIVVGLLEVGSLSKNKDLDDCVLFNSGCRSDLNKLCSLLMRRKLEPGKPLLHPLTASKYNEAIQHAAKFWGLWTNWVSQRVLFATLAPVTTVTTR